MADPTGGNPSQNTRLNRLIAEYLRRVDSGEAVDVEALVAAFPELADEFREYLAGEVLVGRRSDPGQPQRPEGSVVEDTAPTRATDETIRPRTGQKAVTEQEGRTFGRYRLVKELGEGAMGTVFLAFDTELERHVALKMPKFAGDDGPELLERFDREAKAAANLSHPNICQVHDIGEHEGTPYITMAYIEGQPLSRFVGTPQYRDEQVVARLVRVIALALAEAHKKDVIHRDLKPGNILIDARNQPMVTDFGLARRVSQKEESRLTHEGTILGTPAYMPTEQVEGDQARIGPRSDIYSLGVILYELLTGELPFKGTVAAVIGQILRDDPTPPSELRSSLDPRLEAICLQMMAKSPDERYASMNDAARAIGDFCRAVSRGEPPKTKTKSAANRQLEGRRQQVQELVREGQYAGAVKELEKLARLTEPEAKAYASWARKELPRVRNLAKRLRQDVPVLVETAKELLKTHDYGGVVDLLQGIPDGYRSDDVIELLDEAIELQEECELLTTDIRNAVQQREYDGLLPNVERLLELKPGSRKTRELYESLKTYGRGQRYRLDDRGKLLPAPSGLGLTEGWKLAVAVGVVAFCLMTWAVTAYLRSGGQTLDVETDPVQTEDQTETRPPDDSGEPGDTNHPTTVPALEEGEIALFNGRDLEQWQAVPQESSADWIVENGAIACASDKSTVLWTERPYGNFVLKLEYLLDATADAGIYLRSHSRQHGTTLLPPIRIYGAYVDAVEVSLRGDEAKAGDDGTGRNGGIYQLVPPTGDAFQPGQWNEIEIRAESANLTVILNGDEVVRANLESLLTENPDKPFLSNALGYIGLQSYSGDGFAGTVRYRNIRMHELDQQPDFESEPLETLRFEGVGEFPRLAVSPDGRLMASSPGKLSEDEDRDSAVRVWDLASGSQKGQLDGQVGIVVCLGFAADSRTVLCVLRDKILRWDIESGSTNTAKLPRTISFAALSDDGLKIASSTADGQVRLLDATTGNEIHGFGRVDHSCDMEFIPRSQRFVATSDRTIAVVGPEADTVIDLPKDHKDAVFSVAVSPDGTRALSGGGYSTKSQDFSIRHWDLQTRQVIRTLEGHTGQVGRVCFGPDGRYALSSERGPTRKTILWDLQTGKEICRIHCLAWGAHFTPDGRHALLAHRDGTVRLWKLPLPATSPDAMVPATVPVAEPSKTEPLAQELPAGHLSQKELENLPDGSTPFHGHTYEVFWENARFQLDYRGVMGVQETSLGRARGMSPVGLAFHPDGRIAVSDGRGSTDEMLMKFWDKGELREPVVDIKWIREQQTTARREEEVTKGRLWFFNGPLTFDKSGTCYFNLGQCSPNGVYKVLSTSPIRIRKLYDAPPSGLMIGNTLHVPEFDDQHLYLTAATGIFRYSIGSSRGTAASRRRANSGPEGWLSMKRDKYVCLSAHSLILSADRVVLTLRYGYKGADGQEDKECTRSLLLDRKARTFHVLPWEHSGPMAISFDGKRLIRFNKTSETINEFHLGSAPK